MKKKFTSKSNITILIICFLLSFNIGFCQSGLIGGSGGSQDFVTGTSVTLMTPSLGTSQILTLNSLGTGNRYFRLVRNSNIQMGPNTTCAVASDKDISSLLSQTIAIGNTNCNLGGWFINCPNTTDNYVFKVPSINAQTNFVCHRVQGPIQTVTAVSKPSGDKVLLQNNYLVNATISGAFSIGQRVYMRYSSDNFTTSTVTAMAAASGTSYLAYIPSYSGLTIKYYVFTSGNINVLADGSNADFYTINSNGSTTTPFTYQVVNCKADFNITSDTIQCLTGNNFTFTNLSTVVSPETLTYSWNYGDGSAISNAASNPKTYATANTYYVKLNITSSNTACKDSIVKQIKVNAFPTFAPIAGTTTVCVAKTTQLSEATAGGVWKSVNTGVATVNASGLVTGVSAGTSIIRYTVTNGGGCTDSVSTTVTVNALPAFAPIAGTTTICAATTSQLSETTSGGVWKSVSTGVATVNASGLVTGVSAGTSIIRYTVTNGSGCTDSVATTVTVKATSSSTTSKIICPSSLPYLWNSLTFNTSGSQTAHLTNSVGCDSSATLNLTVKATSTSITNTSICPNSLPYLWNGLTFNVAGSQTAHLTNSVGCDSAATLNLTVKATSTSITNASICPTALPYSWNGLTFNVAGSQTAHLTNSVGCDSAATLNLTVNASIIASVSGTVSACNYSAQPNITFTGANATPPYTFTYKINSGANQTVTSTGNIATVAVPTSTVGSLVYSLISVVDASSTTCSQIQTGSATVTINPLPAKPKLKSAPSIVCQNTYNHNYAVNSSSPGNGVGFRWLINGASSNVVASISNADSGNAVLNFPSASATSAVVKVIDSIYATGCVNDSSFTIPINVNTEDLTSPVYYYATPQNGTAGNLVCVNNFNISGSIKYQWGYDSKNDLVKHIIDGQTQQNYYNANIADSSNKYYWTTVTSSSGCFSKNYYNKPNGRGIIIYPIASADLSVKLSPNPTTSSITLNWNNTIWNDDILITVTNISGKVEMQKLIEKQANIGNIILNTANLSRGLHLISLSNKGESKGSIKFIKQ